MRAGWLAVKIGLPLVSTIRWKLYRSCLRAAVEAGPLKCAGCCLRVIRLLVVDGNKFLLRFNVL
jgi:hypothetical protein